MENDTKKRAKKKPARKTNNNMNNRMSSAALSHCHFFDYMEDNDCEAHVLAWYALGSAIRPYSRIHPYILPICNEE